MIVPGPSTYPQILFHSSAGKVSRGHDGTAKSAVDNVGWIGTVEYRAFS
jgi:hypothetical protein